MDRQVKRPWLPRLRGAPDLPMFSSKNPRQDIVVGASAPSPVGVDRGAALAIEQGTCLPRHHPLCLTVPATAGTPQARQQSHIGPDRVRKVVQAIMAPSASTPAEPSEMASSDSLMGLAGLLWGRVDPTYL